MASSKEVFSMRVGVPVCRLYFYVCVYNRCESNVSRVRECRNTATNGSVYPCRRAQDWLKASE